MRIHYMNIIMTITPVQSITSIKKTRFPLTAIGIMVIQVVSGERSATSSTRGHDVVSKSKTKTRVNTLTALKHTYGPITLLH